MGVSQKCFSPHGSRVEPNDLTNDENFTGQRVILSISRELEEQKYLPLIRDKVGSLLHTRTTGVNSFGFFYKNSDLSINSCGFGYNFVANVTLT